MKYFIKILLFLTPYFCQSQEFRGGEIKLVRQLFNDKLDITTDIYFKSEEAVEKPFLLMIYSTGFIDTAFLENHLFLPNQVQLLRYHSSFTAPALNALYQITVLDTFELPILNNLTGEDSGTFSLFAEIQLASILFGESNSPPTFNSLQTDIINFDGILLHDLLAEDPDDDELYYAFSDFSEFEGYEYSLPQADEEISISEDGEFIWSRPIEQGKYLIEFLVYEIYPNSNILLSTTKRTMIIDTEDDFITNVSNVTNEMNINIFPNPTTSKIHINLEGIPVSTTLVSTIIDVYGKTVAEYNFNSSDTQTINVEHLPSGIYFLKIETENQIFSKKFVKQ